MNEVLRGHLAAWGYQSIGARIVVVGESVTAARIRFDVFGEATDIFNKRVIHPVDGNAARKILDRNLAFSFI